MAVNKAIRADDVSGLSIATVQNTDTDAVAKDFQRIVLNDATTAGQMAAVSAAGALKVDGSAVTQPVSIAATVNARPTDGTNPITTTYDLDSGAGTQYNLGVSLRLSSSGGSVEGGTASNPLQVSLANTAANSTAVKVDNSGVTQPVSASSLPLPTGASTAAKQPALGTAGTASADVITIQGIASMTAVKVDGSGVTQPVSLAAAITNTPIPNATSTGLAISKTDALVATAVSVKGTAGNLYGYHIYNSNPTDMFVQFYNIASAGVTVGTSTRLLTLVVPAGGVLDGIFAIPIAFSTAISIAATTTIAGSSAPSTGLLTNIFYL